MPTLRTMDDLPLDGKCVLVRVDFNVAIGEDGKVSATEDFRLEAAIETIQELQQRRCRVLLLTHLGRPKENPGEMELTPIRRRLERLLGEVVREIPALYGQAVTSIVDSMEQGSVALLPNVRLDAREEAGNKRFAQQLAAQADAYVNEAFSVSHRAHTSVAILPQELPSCAGRRTVLEITQLSRLIHDVEQPYVAILGGAKISTKIGMIHDLLGKVDALCLGGQLANIFIAALGQYPQTQFDPDDLAAARYILENWQSKLILPVDLVAGDKDGKAPVVVSVNEIPATATGLYDVGPKTVSLFVARLAQAKTIMWNGPVGQFEIPAYAAASHILAKEISRMNAYRVVGGGNTVNILEQEKVVRSYDHVSVGGGAMVSFLEGKVLPGLAVLYDA